MLSLHTKKRTHQIHLPKTATAEAFSLLPFCYIHFLRVGFTLTSGLIVPSIAPFPSSEFCMFSRIRTNSRPEVFPGTASGKTLSQSDFTFRAQAVCSPMRLRRASLGRKPCFVAFFDASCAAGVLHFFSIRIRSCRLCSRRNRSCRRRSYLRSSRRGSGE